MTRPENLFERASYDLNKFRERRIAERRAQPRDSLDRRVSQPINTMMQRPDTSPGEYGKDAG